ncbi:hypothetical protein O3M35_006267 [Rhynocoris fuscipes]|uniref:UBA domain-containing protein n=1 Tax=Rhynocoris fuscipes TaxID=488301 RepID=A0AAW1DIN3_9HEMI
MFPNQSSSYEISSKTNAFVQINEEDKSGGVNGKAQPHISDNPTLQVPDDRDKMVVVKGADEKKVDPILTVITNHPSQAPTQITSQSSGCERESDGSSIMPQAERKLEGALCFDSIKCTSNNEIRVKDINLIIKNPSQSETLENIPLTNDDADFASFKICDYYSRWGIPRCMKLYGGGESSLTTGTAGWGTPPTSTGGSATGWTGGSSNQPQQTQQQGGSSQQTQNSGNNSTGGTNVPSSQWGSNNNSSSAGNNNGTGNNRQGQQSQQQGSAGGQQQQQGPPSQSQAPPVTSSSSPTTTSAVPNNANGVSNNNNNGGIGQQQTQGVSGTQQSQQQGGTSGQNGPTWAAAAGKGLPPTSQSQGMPSSANSNSTNAVNSTKQQMEQLNTMREALFSQDGWGGQNVNQDSNWDIPGSPEPGSKDNSNNSAVPLWKLPINNGTDLWEANLRNGGMPPPQSQTQKTPWGHTPSSNIGGTWGEDDEGDASNVWTGIPPASGSAAPQWPNQPPIWPGGAKKDGDWGGPNWNDQRDPRDLRHNEMRPMMDNRESLRPGSMDHRSMGGNDVLMRGDPRGISGRLNGVTSEAMWPTGPTGPHHHMAHHQGKLNNHPSQPGVNQWGGGGGPPIKDMGGLGSKTTGWEEPSPPAQRRTMPNYDDGTSLWGQQHSRPAMPGQNKVSHWKEMPTATGMGRGSLQCPPGRGNPNIKPDQPLWPHHPRNGGWSEGAGMDVGSAWAEEKPAPWMDQTLTPSSWAGGPKQHKPSWDGDLDPSSWVHPTKQPTKTISKEMIWASKQFRILSEMGFKKEEVENTLRASGMNLEDALEQLNASRNIGDRWRHSELDPDHPGLNPYPSQICLAYQPNGGGGSGGAGGPNVLANSNQSLSTLSPAIVQKLLSQQPPPQQQPPFTQQSSRTQPTQQPSPQQLRMLVQQIQMAVQSGYLSPQILNQPLAPQTLILLNQLLQQIKNLQQLTQHQLQMQVGPLGKPPSNNSQMLISVQITKTKQQICNLQNQIAAQQAVYVKHQQQTPPTNDFFKAAMHEPISALHSNFSDLSLKETQVTGSTSQQSRLNQWKLPALDKDSDMGSGNDFSRAPGSTAKATPGSSSPNINPLLGQPDGTWSSVSRSNCDTGWPDSGADEPSSKDWPTSTQPPSQVFSDLVPEFEPGKPWKGNPLKSIEDDPSLTPGSVVRSPLSLPSIKDTHILSSSSSVPGKASPTTSSSLDIMPPIPSLSLSSSTWSFNPPVSTTNGGGLAKLSGSKSSNTSSGSGGSGGGSAGGGGAVGTGGSNSGTGGPWGEPGTGGSTGSVQAATSELWVTTPKSRGPPPGLPAKPQSQTQGQSTTSAPTTNGWGSLGSRWPAPSQAPWPSSQPAAPTQAGSTWLLLRNLTPQIDGSTLKTLCLQHGPLQNFHLYLNHGIALAKYTSREEANKAQGALNNCVLGNTTIFAESPSESDVMSLLQHLGHSTGGSSSTSGGGGGSWRTPAAKEPSWAWGGGAGGAGAPGAGTATSLWAEPPDQHRTTPSSINSFLPGDLLGGESI